MSLKSIFAYSFQSFYLAGSFLLLFIFLPSFYNLSLGFALSTLGLIILISRLFDVFSDVYIGYQTEKRVVNGKSKKRQIQFGILVFIFSLIGLYVVQPSNIYLFIFYYNLALISYSIAIIPYDSIVIDQKKISTRRFHLATIKEIFTIIGVICALVFPTVVSKILSVELLSPQVIKLTGIFMIVVSIIGIAIFHFFCDEESQYQSKAVSIKQIKFFIFKNTKVTSLAIITFFNLLANNFTANLFIIFVSIHLGLPDYAGLLLILYFLNKFCIDLNNLFLFLEISTPKLDPSLIGLVTIGKLIFLFFKAFSTVFLLKQFFLIEKYFGVFILFFIKIFFE